MRDERVHDDMGGGNKFALWILQAHGIKKNSNTLQDFIHSFITFFFSILSPVHVHFITYTYPQPNQTA